MSAGAQCYSVPNGAFVMLQRAGVALKKGTVDTKRAGPSRVQIRRGEMRTGSTL